MLHKFTLRAHSWGTFRLLGQYHHLCPKNEPGAETDLEGEAATELGMFREQPVGGEWD